MKKPAAPKSKLARMAGMVDAGRHARALRSETDSQLRSKAAQHVATRLGRLRGLPQKMGQILSMSDDAELEAVFETLQSSAEPVALDALTPVMEEAWGRPVSEVCRQIESDGHAASLGQVHRATLVDGTEVAIKVQYPGIRNAIQSDLTLLGWLGKPFGGFARGFEMADYQQAIGSALDAELDYTEEAVTQEAYARHASGLGVVIPEVFEDLSSSQVLVTRWEDGDTFREACNWSASERHQLASSLAEHFMVMLFRHGVLHADPHPGNYRFRRVGRRVEIVLYDFGSVHRVADEERLALLRLIQESYRSVDAAPYPLFLKLGFSADTLSPLRHKLPALCRVLFAPFGVEGKFDLATWKRGERVSAVLGEDRWNFRISGPAQLLFLMRAFHGLVYYLERLEQPIQWRRPFESLARESASNMRQLSLLDTSEPCSTYAALAQHLCVKVTEGSHVKAKVSLPASAVERLESLLSEDVRVQVDARGIDLDTIVQTARTRQYAPQELFQLQEGDKLMEVWLE